MAHQGRRDIMKIIEKCIYKMPKMVYNKCVRRESH